MKRRVYIICFLLILPAFLSAQVAVRADLLLDTNAVNYQEVAQFVLEAAGLLSDTPLEEAFHFATVRQWLPTRVSPDEEARLDRVALLIMRSFNVRGGVMYSLFQNPRYAYRELVRQGVIQGRTASSMPVSGELLVSLVTEALSHFDLSRITDTYIEVPVVLPVEIPVDIPDFESVVEVIQPPIEEPVEPPAEEPEVTLFQPEILAQEITASLEAAAVANTFVRIVDGRVSIASNIQFLPDSAELPLHELEKLWEIARILQAVPARNLLVTGHTALAGTETAQLVLSRERAEIVRYYLVSMGVRDASEITAQGIGARQPIADNNTAAGRALNRRVEIIIMEQR